MRIVKKKNSTSDLFGDKAAVDECAPEPAPVVEGESTAAEKPISTAPSDSEVKSVAVTSEATSETETNTFRRFSRQSSVTTVTTVTQVMSSSSTVSSDRNVDDKEQSETVRKVSTGSRTIKRSHSRHLPEPEAVQPEMAHTLDITSSYGTGPLDENGRPLFGLGALRRRPKLNLDAESDLTNGRISMFYIDTIVIVGI